MGSERRGTWVYYWIQPAALNRLSALLQAPAPDAAPGPTSIPGPCG
ncbi:ArsR family transcriptional regulator [Streptomyces sp. DvalAA-14]|nr:ArsR family transcriptional regulator [Streptomyces sp. DvalAA-14]